MKEAEWMTCYEPDQMLMPLRDWASDRKFRFFTCACLKQAKRLHEISPLRDVIQAIEQFTEKVNGKIDLIAADRLLAAGRVAHQELDDLDWPNVCYYLAIEEGWKAAQAALKLLAKNHLLNRKKKRRVYSDLIRCVFGNPFRFTDVDSSWITSTVVALAQEAHESQDFSVLPILADALQDAGCENEDILNHCRQRGEHCRGCWVVDLTGWK
jgi:hypothetical protein